MSSDQEQEQWTKVQRKTKSKTKTSSPKFNGQSSKFVSPLKNRSGLVRNNGASQSTATSTTQSTTQTGATQTGTAHSGSTQTGPSQSGGRRLRRTIASRLNGTNPPLPSQEITPPRPPVIAQAAANMQPLQPASYLLEHDETTRILDIQCSRMGSVIGLQNSLKFLPTNVDKQIRAVYNKYMLALLDNQQSEIWWKKLLFLPIVLFTPPAVMDMASTCVREVIRNRCKKLMNNEWDSFTLGGGGFKIVWVAFSMKTS